MSKNGVDETWDKLERASEEEWREFKEKINKLLASYGYDREGVYGFNKITRDKDRKPKNKEEIKLQGLRKSRTVGIIAEFEFTRWGWQQYREAPWNGFWYTMPFGYLHALLDYELLEKAVKQGTIDFKYNNIFLREKNNEAKKK